MCEPKFLVQVPRIFDGAVRKDNAILGFSVPLTPEAALQDSNEYDNESTNQVFSYWPPETEHADEGEEHTKDF